LIATQMAVIASGAKQPRGLSRRRLDCFAPLTRNSLDEAGLLSLLARSDGVRLQWLCRVGSPRRAGTSCGLGDRFEFDAVSEFGELGDEALGFDLGRAAVEVVGAEIVMFGAVLQHVIDRGQH
jgi:hypothetical protein